MWQPERFQEDAIQSAEAALDRYMNTIIVVPTGGGKTVIMAIIARRYGKVLIVQSRDNLVSSNKETFEAANDTDDTGIIQGYRSDWGARFVFASRDTIINRLDDMPNFEAVFFDEAHGLPAPSNQAILARVREINPKAHLLAVTATPERGDRKLLTEAGINNCAYIVEDEELMRDGLLVRPRVLEMDIGVGSILEEGRFPSPHAEDPVVSAYMRTHVSKNAIFDAYRRYGEDRLSVWFCSSRAAAEDMSAAFNAAGERAAYVHGGQSTAEQRASLAAFESGEVRHLFNMFVLVEGWDYPPTALVGLLRPFGHRSPMKQAVGRGLRIVRPERFPGIEKEDCLVLDFCGNFERHPHVFDAPRLEVARGPKGDAPTKDCTECGFKVHLSARTCPNCGHDFPVKVKAGKREFETVVMVERDLRRRSKWKWLDLGPQTKASANFEGAVILREKDGIWQGASKARGRGWRIEHVGPLEEVQAVCDIVLNEVSGSGGKDRKGQSWMYKPPTAKQLSFAKQIGVPIPTDRQINRYEINARTQARLALKSGVLNV